MPNSLGVPLVPLWSLVNPFCQDFLGRPKKRVGAAHARERYLVKNAGFSLRRLRERLFWEQSCRGLDLVKGTFDRAPKLAEWARRQSCLQLGGEPPHFWLDTAEPSREGFTSSWSRGTSRGDHLYAFAYQLLCWWLGIYPP